MVDDAWLEGFDVSEFFKSNAEFKSWAARHLEHANLDPDVTENKLKEFLARAETEGFSIVRVPPAFLKNADRIIKANKYRVGTIILVSFPAGDMLSTNQKLLQLQEGADAGAKEVEFVCNMGFLKGDVGELKKEVTAAVKAARAKKMKISIAFDLDKLSEEEAKAGIETIESAGPDFLSISTDLGFYSGEDLPEDEEELKLAKTRDVIRLAGKHVKNKSKLGIKVANGIYDLGEFINGFYMCVKNGWSLENIRVSSRSAPHILESINV